MANAASKEAATSEVAINGKKKKKASSEQEQLAALTAQIEALKARVDQEPVEMTRAAFKSLTERAERGDEMVAPIDRRIIPFGPAQGVIVHEGDKTQTQLKPALIQMGGYTLIGFHTQEVDKVEKTEEDGWSGTDYAIAGGVVAGAAALGYLLSSAFGGGSDD